MQSEKRGWRARLLAHMMAKGSPRYESLVENRKKILFSQAEGVVVEIGAGTGPNLRFLRGVHEYIASEPNPYMHPRLRQEIARNQVSGTVDPRPAEILLAELPMESVDHVVSTLVLCSVSDPDSLLRQVRRILRPSGRLLLLEHVGAEQGTALCACQHLLSPCFRWLGDGCNPTRDTLQVVRSAGFSKSSIEEFRLPLGPIAPHLCGWLEK